MSPYTLIALMCLAEVIGMVSVFTFPALLPQFIGEWRLSNTDAGWINGIFFGGYSLAVPVLASLTDRVDGRRIYLISAALSALAALGFALYANGFWSALAFRALGGLALAGTFIPGLKALVDRLDGTAKARAKARAISFYTATFSLGMSLSFFISGWMGQRYGWQSAFIIAAAGSFLALLLAMCVLRPLPNIRRKTTTTHLLDFRPVLRNPTTLAYTLAYTAHMWELFGLRSWLVAFLAFSITLQPEGTNFWPPATVAAVGGLVAMWASVGGAELALRFGRRRIISLIMLASTLMAIGFGFSAELPYHWVAMLAVCYLFLAQGESAALHTGVILSAPPSLQGTAMATQSLFGFASAALAPLAVGWVLDATGGGTSTTSWGMAFLTLGLVVILGPLTLRRMADKLPAG